MAEWLRRWTRNPMGSPRAGSNPAHSVRTFGSGYPCLRRRKAFVFLAPPSPGRIRPLFFGIQPPATSPRAPPRGPYALATVSLNRVSEFLPVTEPSTLTSAIPPAYSASLTHAPARLLRDCLPPLNPTPRGPSSTLHVSVPLSRKACYHTPTLPHAVFPFSLEPPLIKCLPPPHSSKMLLLSLPSDRRIAKPIDRYLAQAHTDAYSPP